MKVGFPIQGGLSFANGFSRNLIRPVRSRKRPRGKRANVPMNKAKGGERSYTLLLDLLNVIWLGR